MAEITEAQIIAKIAAIDAKIDTIISAMAGGVGSAQYSSYKIGQLSVDGSKQIEQLTALRKTYQDLLISIPKETAEVATYDVDLSGDDFSEELGDE